MSMVTNSTRAVASEPISTFDVVRSSPKLFSVTFDAASPGLRECFLFLPSASDIELLSTATFATSQFSVKCFIMGVCSILVPSQTARLVPESVVSSIIDSYSTISTCSRLIMWDSVNLWKTTRRVTFLTGLYLTKVHTHRQLRLQTKFTKLTGHYEEFGL